MFFRAFYAVRDLRSSTGVPVNAVYGFISMVAKLLKEKNPEYIVFCYDRKEPSFRKELDVNYKANRTTMPDDLQVQMPYIKQVAGLFGIMDLEAAGYEADDLIGTISRMAYDKGFETYIVSGDKDFCQLINEKTFLYDTMKETVTTEAGVQEKYGVSSAQFRDYLAITGDTSDNIPGVAGIGPKGAQKLIEEFNNLENIYINIEKIKSAGIKQKLIDSRDQAFLSQKLVTIVTDVKIDKSFEDFKRLSIKKEELRAFFQELNFKTFEKTLLGDNQETFSKNIEVTESIPEAPAEIKMYELIQSKEIEFSKNLEKILTQDSFWFLYSNQGVENLAVAVGNDISLVSAEAFRAAVSDSEALKICWSGFDLKSIWKKIGFSPEIVNALNLKSDLMLEYYLIKGTDATDYFSVFKKQIKVDLDAKTVQPTEVYNHMIELKVNLADQLNDPALQAVYQKLDLPMVQILYKMESLGVKLDIPRLKVMSKQLEDHIEVLEKEIHEITGEKFNIASPKQLGTILFEKMNLPVIKKTKTGYSTDNEVLESLNHPVGPKLIDYREVTKLKSTYVDSLPEQVDAEDRVHTHFQQALTATGRLSSINPNLQNIPIKTARGQEIRKSFIADTGKKLLCLDYSQIELRVLAHISQDKNLVKAFMEGHDIHTATASEVFSVKLEDVNKDQRRIAKAVNFGIAYGQGAFGLAETLGVSRTESKDIITRYFKQYSGIKDYIDSTIEFANKNKYVETIFGRKRFLPELSSPQVMIRKFGERAAINAPIQGTASDLVKLAMIDIAKTTSLNMILQIHDELMFEDTTENIERELKQIVFKMENVAALKVPLKVNYSVGDNWDESH